MKTRTIGLAMALLLGLVAIPALAAPQSQPAAAKLTVTYFYLPG